MCEEDRVIQGLEPPPFDGPIDTPEKLATVLAGLEPGKLVCVFQPELPDFPDEDEDDQDYVICKIMRDDGSDDPPPFFLIGLGVDREEIKIAAEEIIEKGLEGKVTAGGYLQ